MRRHYPLRLHLATLFGALVVLAGTLIGLYNQHLLRSQLNEATRQQAQGVAERTRLSLQGLLRPVESALQVLSRTQVLAVPADLEDSALREVLRSLLDQEEQLDAAYVADGEGRFYILRALRDDAARARFEAPAEARYLSQHITQPGQAGRRAFMDAALVTLRSSPDPDYAQRYDPRQRPWYRQAQDAGALVRTGVYRFFATQLPGLTVALPSLDFPDRVLGADLRLDTVEQWLRAQRLTPGHRLALVNEKGELVAADEPGARLDDFAAAREGGAAAQGLGATLPVGLGLSLLTQVPEDDLQAGARAAVRRSGVITLGLVLLSLPLALWLARRVAQPLQQLTRETRAIKRFEFDDVPPAPSRISEVAEMGEAIASMRRTIRRFVEVTGLLSEETDFERLQRRLVEQTLPAVEAQAGVLYLAEGEALQARCALRADRQPLPTELQALPALQGCGVHLVEQALLHDRTLGGLLAADELARLGLAGCGWGGGIVVPLHNRKRERIGALLLLCEGEPLPTRVRFAEAVSASAATAIETRELIQAQRQLFEAFIELIAAAIDAKSPYTGGHCARVPQLTKMLAQAACDAREGPFATFQLDEEAWEALHVAAWLHDCGKVTTPDYVVDKATKLETIYNRIHELRTRFEVLKRDAEIEHLQRRLAGMDAATSAAQRDAAWQQLDEDFAFVAHCNVGGEFLSDADQERLRRIGARRWLRTLDDRLGLSHEELRRAEQHPAPALPHAERLIDDKPEHRIARDGADPALQPDNRWGFQLEVPALLYDRGELKNLTVSRGTLSDEERFKINEHIVQTIVMLGKLPYPRHLRAVPEIAGGHHEKMDGSGYPKRLRREQMSLPARMMAIADIFEALTAADRPYKRAKTLSEALGIMARMAGEAHIDTELFALFVQSGVAQRYAQQFMAPALVDEVDEAALLQRASRGTA